MDDDPHERVVLLGRVLFTVVAALLSTLLLGLLTRRCPHNRHGAAAGIVAALVAPALPASAAPAPVAPEEEGAPEAEVLAAAFARGDESLRRAGRRLAEDGHAARAAAQEGGGAAVALLLRYLSAPPPPLADARRETAGVVAASLLYGLRAVLCAVREGGGGAPHDATLDAAGAVAARVLQWYTPGSAPVEWAA